jgi:hypothetical protein
MKTAGRVGVMLGVDVAIFINGAGGGTPDNEGNEFAISGELTLGRGVGEVVSGWSR